MLISGGLFRRVLISPSHRADELRIVSGYATAMMAKRHFAECQNLRISLIVGMCPKDGVSMSNHMGFVKLADSLNGQFTCLYQTKQATHSKLYVWYREGQPIWAYVGSANYTQNAFILKAQKEIICRCDPIEADAYYSRILRSSVSCTAPDIENKISILNLLTPPRIGIGTPAAAPEMRAGLHEVDLPLVTTRGDVHQHGGLNWGQRDARDHNEAYIPIPASIARSGFFPPRKVHFNVLTDDGVIMEFSVAQEGGKALHTPENNAIMGRYFRRRLGVRDGACVTKSDLEHYGRTSVKILKDDDENYYLDFSQN